MGHRVPADLCPCCGYVFDRATMFEDPTKAPTPGCATICFNCGAVLLYDEGMRTVPAPEIEEDLEPRVLRLVAYIRKRGRLVRPVGEAV